MIPPSDTLRTAFVLAGGGSLGAVQVGMLVALAEAGMIPDRVVGASVGALNAVHFAADPGPEGIRRLERVWMGVRRQHVFPARWGTIFGRILFRRDSLVDPGPLRRLITRALPVGRLEDTAIPCTVVATDLVGGAEVRLTAGPAVEALLASAAIPGVFPPVRLGGHELVDGGIASNTPIQAAVDAGARRIVVLPKGFTCAAEDRPRGALAVALHALNLLVAHQLVRDVERASRHAQVFVVPPLCPLDVSSYDFSRTAELIERARASTRAWIEGRGLLRPGGDGALAPHDHRGPD